MPASRSAQRAPMIPTYFLSACCRNPRAVTQHSFCEAPSNNLVQPASSSFLNRLLHRRRCLLISVLLCCFIRFCALSSLIVMDEWPGGCCLSYFSPNVEINAVIIKHHLPFALDIITNPRKNKVSLCILPFFVPLDKFPFCSLYSLFALTSASICRVTAADYVYQGLCMWVWVCVRGRLVLCENNGNVISPQCVLPFMINGKGTNCSLVAAVLCLATFLFVTFFVYTYVNACTYACTHT